MSRSIVPTSLTPRAMSADQLLQDIDFKVLLKAEIARQADVGQSKCFTDTVGWLSDSYTKSSNLPLGLSRAASATSLTPRMMSNDQLSAGVSALNQLSSGTTPTNLTPRMMSANQLSLNQPLGMSTLTPRMISADQKAGIGQTTEVFFTGCSQPTGGFLPPNSSKSQGTSRSMTPTSLTPRTMSADQFLKADSLPAPCVPEVSSMLAPGPRSPQLPPHMYVVPVGAMPAPHLIRHSSVPSSRPAGGRGIIPVPENERIVEERTEALQSLAAVEARLEEFPDETDVECNPDSKKTTGTEKEAFKSSKAKSKAKAQSRQVATVKEKVVSSSGASSSFVRAQRKHNDAVLSVASSTAKTMSSAVAKAATGPNEQLALSNSPRDLSQDEVQRETGGKQGTGTGQTGAKSKRSPLKRAGTGEERTKSRESQESGDASQDARPRNQPREEKQAMAAERQALARERARTEKLLLEFTKTCRTTSKEAQSLDEVQDINSRLEQYIQERTIPREEQTATTRQSQPGQKLAITDGRPAVGASTMAVQSMSSRSDTPPRKSPKRAAAPKRNRPENKVAVTDSRQPGGASTKEALSLEAQEANRERTADSKRVPPIQKLPISSNGIADGRSQSARGLDSRLARTTSITTPRLMSERAGSVSSRSPSGMPSSFIVPQSMSVQPIHPTNPGLLQSALVPAIPTREASNLFGHARTKGQTIVPIAPMETEQQQNCTIS